MPLITTIQEVRDSGVNVNFINEDSNIADMITAELMYIKPILGKDLYAALSEEPDGAPGLLVKVQRALAPLAYFLYLPNIQTQITDKGLATSDSNNMTAAHKWEYEAKRDALEAQGCFALEDLLEYLNDPDVAADLNWTIPDEYNLIFKTGTEFNKYFPLYQPYRTFFSMRPLLQMVQDQILIATIGEDFFIEMRDLALPEDKTTWSADEKKQAAALLLLKRAAAFYTIVIAVDQLPVKISNNGFTVSLRDAVDKPNPQEQTAPNTQLYNLQKSAMRSADAYLVQLSDYLNANANDTLFATYKASSYYTAPAAADNTDPNSTQNIFTL